MPRSTKLEPLSSLYCRANGFLLGCFQSLIRYRFARDEFGVLRGRMVEFLEEAGITVEIPRSQRAYAKNADQQMVRIFKATAARAPELGDFVFMGSLCCSDAIMRLAGQLPSEQLRDAAVERMKSRGLDGAGLYELFLVDVRLAKEESGDSEVHIQFFLTPALALLDNMIQPLPMEDGTCFVAMPFARPYSGYFARLYRPFAREMDCAAFRMWGGLPGEAYVDLMLTIIRRCGLVVAELTGLKPNVIYEVGVARGLEKKVILLCQRGDIDRVPANIGSDQLLLTYSPRERDWPKLTVLRFAAQDSLMNSSRRWVERRVAAAKRAPGQALPEVPRDPDEKEKVKSAAATA